MFEILPNQGIAGALVAPAGTRLAFQQATAPGGWTVDTQAGLSDCSFRVNQATGGQIAGTTGWSSWNFGGSFNVNTFTLSTPQLPSHSHTITDPGHAHGLVDPGHVHGVAGGGAFITNQAAANAAQPGGGLSAQAMASQVTGITMATATTGIAGTNNTGSGAGITPTFTVPNVKFADFLIGVKS